MSDYDDDTKVLRVEDMQNMGKYVEYGEDELEQRAEEITSANLSVKTQEYMTENPVGGYQVLKRAAEKQGWEIVEDGQSEVSNKGEFILGKNGSGDRIIMRTKGLKNRRKLAEFHHELLLGNLMRSARDIGNRDKAIAFLSWGRDENGKEVESDDRAVTPSRLRTRQEADRRVVSAGVIADETDGIDGGLAGFEDWASWKVFRGENSELHRRSAANFYDKKVGSGQ